MPLHKTGFPSSHEKWNVDSSAPRLETSEANGSSFMIQIQRASEGRLYYRLIRFLRHLRSGYVSTDSRDWILKLIVFGAAIALAIILWIVAQTAVMTLAGAWQLRYL